MQCRVYLAGGKYAGMPSKEMLRAALQSVLADSIVPTVNEPRMERFLSPFAVNGARSVDQFKRVLMKKYWLHLRLVAFSFCGESQRRGGVGFIGGREIEAGFGG